jgi:hypothetical protein
MSFIAEAISNGRPNKHPKDAALGNIAHCSDVEPRQSSVRWGGSHRCMCCLEQEAHSLVRLNVLDAGRLGRAGRAPSFICAHFSWKMSPRMKKKKRNALENAINSGKEKHRAIPDFMRFWANLIFKFSMFFPIFQDARVPK